MTSEINITSVGPVVTEKDGKIITDNSGNPSAFMTVGFGAPLMQTRHRNVWGRVNVDGTITWERLSPEQAAGFMKQRINLAEYGVRLVARDVVPFTPEGLENAVKTARLVVFPDETEQQALARLYGADAQFKDDRRQLDESSRAADLAHVFNALQTNGAV